MFGIRVLIGAFPLVLAGYAAPVAAEVSGRDLVEALNGIFGQHAGQRASHAKGICAAGEFRATEQAPELSRAELFGAEPALVRVRFSMGGGNPVVPDTARAVRGLAARFSLPDGGVTDLIMLSAPVFLARNPEQVFEFLRVREVDPATGLPDPEKVAAFSAANPETTRQAAWLAANPPADSYLSTRFFGVNAFRFINDGDEAVYGRWQIEPADGVVELDEAQLAELGDDFLSEDLVRRLAAGPSAFEVYVQLAGEGDDVTDPTVSWPESRPRVHVGTLNLTSEEGQSCDTLMFNPLALPAGIEPSEDATLRVVRTTAYVESLARRLQRQ
ncbi:MAG: catalase family peroxidase [Chromatiales bacterium]|nr:catalase family peroxidase [Chromatiales bacterium]